MWTANLDSITKTGGNAKATVTYTDGNSNITEVYTFASPEILKQTAINKINQLTQIDTYVATTVTGAINTTVTPPADPIPPTQAVLDRQQWMTDYTLWVKIKTTLIDTGVLTGSEAAVTALKTKVQTNFKPAYLTSLNLP